MSIGRGEEGLEEQRKVLDLDPISVPALFSYAQTLYRLRRYNNAIYYFRKALSLNPSFPREHAGLGLACIRKGSFTRGIAELKLAKRRQGIRACEGEPCLRLRSSRDIAVRRWMF